MKQLLPKLAFIPFILALLFGVYTYAARFFETDEAPIYVSIHNIGQEESLTEPEALPVSETTETTEDPVNEEPEEKQPADNHKTQPDATKQTTTAAKIQVALLLDVSGSMSGLIDQAKAQLWTLVNELSKAEYEGKAPTLEIALYEYGNNEGIRGNQPAYLKQMSPLTSDLDFISEKLFALAITGSDEYCGEVIHQSLTELEWSASAHDMKMIFIAGNEEFTQGPVPYTQACKDAINKGIVVNTIFCGNYNDGIAIKWKDGADITDGKYMNIDHNQVTAFVETPFDSQIASFNDSLNKTYVAFGTEGKALQQRQVTQDYNASSYSSANLVNRALTKSSANYKNSNWDLVDATKEKDFDWNKVEEEALPAELKGLDNEKRQKVVDEKLKQRENFQQQIVELNEKREEFIRNQNQNNSETQMLNDVMMEAVKENGKKLNYKFK